MSGSRSLPVFLMLLVHVTLSPAQWVQTNGPQGGTVDCFAVAGANSFAGTAGDGVFLSTNNGTSWKAVNIGLTNTMIHTLVVSGPNLFAGTSGGVFLSTNNGTTWTATATTNPQVFTLAVSGPNLFAGTAGGVYISNNNGAGWATYTNALTNIDVRALAISGANLFAGTNGSGVFLSTNNGTSWTATATTNPTVFALAVSGTNLFAGTYGGVYMSNNNGASWSTVNDSLTSPGVTSLAVSGSSLFAGTIDGGVFLTTNSGTRWTAVNSGLTNTSVLALDTSGTILFAGTGGGGVFLSTNSGTSWTAGGSGLTNAAVYALAPSGTNLLAGTSGGGVLLSGDRGTSWTAVNAGLTNSDVRALVAPGTNLLAGTNGSGVFLSTNNGTSWSATGLKNTQVWSLAFSGPNLFAGTFNGVFLSTNNGTSWTGVKTGLTDTSVLALAVSGPNLFAGTGSHGVFLSTNNGATWTQTGLTSATVVSLADSGTNLFAGTAGGVFLSTNNGTSWNFAGTGLTQPVVFALAVYGANVVAGTDSGGIFLSTNSGTIWTAINAGLLSTPVRIHAFAFSGTDIYAATDGASVWRRSLTEIIVPLAPTAAGPSNLATNSFALNWTQSALAASYRFDLARDSLFSLIVSQYGNFAVAGLSQTVTGLTGGTTYYYRVRAENAAGSSGNSNVVRALTIPIAPVAISPTGLLTTSFTANWDSSTGATNYRLDVAKDIAFTQIVPGDSNLAVPGLSKTVNGLNAATTYYYRVRAENSSGQSANSNIITTQTSTLGTPSATAATAVTTAGFTANWTTVAGATGYVLDVAHDTTFTSFLPGYDSLSVAGTSKGVAGLTAGTKYYYRVRAVNAGGPSGFSNTIIAWTLTIAPTLSAATGVTSSGFTANWGPVVGAASYQLDVATDLPFSAFVPGYDSLVVAGTSHSLIGLSASTTYYYRVRGVNVSGTSGSSATGNQLTAPLAPVANGATGMTATGFTANWSASTGATGYKLDVATDTGFASYVSGYMLKEVGDVASSPVTGLTSSTAYYYRVWAYNSGGTSSRSNRVSDTTSSNLPPPAPVAGAATYLTSNSFSANWSASPGASGYDLDVATDSLFTAFLTGYTSRDVGNVTAWTIGGLTGNRTYYYRLWAYGPAGKSGASSKTISVATPVIVLSNTQSYATRNSLTEYSSAEYHLVGIPGNSGQDISAFLSGQWQKDWEVYWDNGKHGAPKDYYDEYQAGSGTFVSSTGKAFWVLNRGDWKLSSSVNTASYDTNHVVTIPLTNGAAAWQLITNPFTVSIPWASITAFNGSADSISTWNGYTLAFSALFEPYKGYQIYNGTGKGVIRIPYSLSLAKAVAKPAADLNAWRVQVVARSGNYSDETTSLGISGGAENGMDIHQQHKPRMLASLPEVYFDRPDLDAEFNDFATDIRRQMTDLGTWDMKVRSDQMQAVQLEFVGVGTVPENLALALIDGAGARSIDLRKQATYVLEPASVITVLQVAIGRPDLVKKLTDAVGPREYALLQNYPNPFNPTTTIPMLIPGQSRVSLRVYNILGQLVTTLYEGDIMPGKYYVTWDGTDSSKRQVSSGIYICRMIANGSIRKTVKLNMIK
jgi:phosphodiesterase/alkaline phosphatase D-like protein